MIKSYRVIWEIDVDADSPTGAAKEALKIQRDKNSTASVFEVIEHESDEYETVDVFLVENKRKIKF